MGVRRGGRELSSRAGGLNELRVSFLSPGCRLELPQGTSKNVEALGPPRLMTDGTRRAAVGTQESVCFKASADDSSLQPGSRTSGTDAAVCIPASPSSSRTWGIDCRLYVMVMVTE